MRWLTLIVGGIGAVLAFFIFCLGLVSVLSKFDFLPGVLVDYETIYLDQARRIMADPVTIHRQWVYPPLLAILLVVFAVTGRRAAWWSWFAVLLLMAGCLYRLCQQELGDGSWKQRWLVPLGLVLVSLPVIHCLKWGQVSLPVAVLAIYAMTKAHKKWYSDTALALAVGLKSYPALYLIDYLIKKEYRRVGVAVVFSVALGFFVPLVFLGWGDLKPFVEKNISVSKDFAGVSRTGSQSLGGAIESWFHTRRHFGLPKDNKSPWLFPLSKGTRRVLRLVLSLLLLVATVWRMKRSGAPGSVSTAMVLVSTTLAINTVWHHYFSFLPFAHAVIMARARGRIPALCALVASWAVAAAPVVLMVPFPNTFNWYSSLAGTTVAALLAWIGLWMVAVPGPNRPERIGKSKADAEGCVR